MPTPDSAWSMSGRMTEPSRNLPVLSASPGAYPTASALVSVGMTPNASSAPVAEMWTLSVAESGSRAISRMRFAP